jgi:hypothetical protein
MKVKKPSAIAAVRARPSAIEPTAESDCCDCIIAPLKNFNYRQLNDEQIAMRVPREIFCPDARKSRSFARGLSELDQRNESGARVQQRSTPSMAAQKRPRRFIKNCPITNTSASIFEALGNSERSMTDFQFVAAVRFIYLRRL